MNTDKCFVFESVCIRVHPWLIIPSVAPHFSTTTAFGEGPWMLLSERALELFFPADSATMAPCKFGKTAHSVDTDASGVPGDTIWW